MHTPASPVFGSTPSKAPSVWTREELLFDLLFVGGEPPIEECNIDERDLPVLAWARKYWLEGNPDTLMTLAGDPTFHAQVKASIELVEIAKKKAEEVEQGYLTTRRAVQLVYSQVLGQSAKHEEMLASGLISQEQFAKRKQCVEAWGRRQEEQISAQNTEDLKAASKMKLRAVEAVLATWDALSSALQRAQVEDEEMIAALTADLDKSLNEVLKKERLLVVEPSTDEPVPCEPLPREPSPKNNDKDAASHPDDEDLDGLPMELQAKGWRVWPVASSNRLFPEMDKAAPKRSQLQPCCIRGGRMLGVQMLQKKALGPFGSAPVVTLDYIENRRGPAEKTTYESARGRGYQSSMVCQAFTEIA